MKFTISKNILIENLNYVSKAITNKTIIPILNGIKFELTKEGLELIATDSELTIKTFINKKDIKEIVSEGICVIQSKYLLDIIKKLPNGDINIEVVDGIKIIISTENTVFNLNCLNTEDYPHLKFEEIKNPINLESDLLKKIINQTIFAISNQESRPLLTGINLKCVDNQLYCIATDSYRLAKKTVELNQNYDNFNIVIPGKNLNELDKILGENNNV